MTGLLAMINWELFAIQLANGVVSTVIVTFALVRILPPRSAWGCWICSLAVTVGCLIFKQLMGSVPFALLSVSIYVAGYVAFLGGSFAARVVVSLLSQVVLFFAEIPAAIVWIVLTQTPVMDVPAMFAHLPAFGIMSLFHVGVTALFFYGFYRACMSVIAGRKPQAREGRSALRPGAFALFPIAQLLFLLCAIFVAFAVVGDDLVLMAAVGVLFILCVAVDLALFAQMRAYADARLAHARAELLAEQVDAYLGAAASIQEALRAAAVLRHDLRNHMQVVAGLCERGERAEAQAYMASAKGELLSE